MPSFTLDRLGECRRGAVTPLCLVNALLTTLPSLTLQYLKVAMLVCLGAWVRDANATSQPAVNLSSGDFALSRTISHYTLFHLQRR